MDRAGLAARLSRHVIFFLNERSYHDVEIFCQVMLGCPALRDKQ